MKVWYPSAVAEKKRLLRVEILKYFRPHLHMRLSCKPELTLIRPKNNYRYNHPQQHFVSVCKMVVEVFSNVGHVRGEVENHVRTGGGGGTLSSKRLT